MVGPTGSRSVARVPIFGVRMVQTCKNYVCQLFAVIWLWAFLNCITCDSLRLNIARKAPSLTDLIDVFQFASIDDFYFDFISHWKCQLFSYLLIICEFRLEKILLTHE